METEIAFHVRRHFTPEALDAWTRLRIRWGPRPDLFEETEAAVLIPTDGAVDEEPRDVWRVPFNGTRLTLWNRLPKPEGWRPIPSADAPLWYLDRRGRVMPAWDLFANLTRLLALGEETASRLRDRHGRFLAAMSPRSRIGLLEVPAFNEAAAALVGIALALRHGELGPCDSLRGALQPPAIVLSHDVDLLRGNDLFTQSVRAYRFLRPLLRARPPEWRSGKALILNASSPRRYYLDAIPRMVELERAAGARSSFYFLNGSRGRFGARSGAADIPEARARIPPGWNLGIHYNYDTLLDATKFENQRRELEKLIGQPVIGGRAHYLRFDPEASFGFLENRGMRYDESLGYPDRIGYRCGVAGAYHPPDPSGERARKIVEIPLAVMDSTLSEQYPGEAERVLERLLLHLRDVGGSLTVLAHPEAWNNPEFPEEDRCFPSVLELGQRFGTRFLLPTDFLDS